MHEKILFEIRRKALHICVTVTIALFLVLFRKEVSLILLASFILIGTYVYIQLKKGKKFAIVSKVLYKFERRGMISKWPGKGAFFLFLGCFLTILLYSEKIAFASILILGFSDSVAAVIGKPFGRLKIGNKSMEGTTAFYFSTFVIVSLLFGYPLAPFVAAIACLSEYIPKIDDNLTVPLISGLTLWSLFS